jgi:hypothetical protein
LIDAEPSMNHSFPAPSATLFKGGISHPDLLLWDAWSYVDTGGVFHLYTLAVTRRKADGSPLLAMERNGVPFHVRHFTSRNRGASWRDQGCFIAPRLGQGLADSRTIWSGSIEPLADGQVLAAYTGLYEVDGEHCFLQTLMLALSDGDAITARAETPVLCPRRDHEMIIEAGYYLAAPADLGYRGGEEGGPVLAWRDPFVFIDGENRLHLFWSAKAGPKLGALGHATLRRDGQHFAVEELLPPTIVQDGDGLTQFELPKIYHDQRNGTYYLISSTCNRLDERQPDSEVEKTIRLHSATSLDGPWRPWSDGGSAVPGLDGMFGMTVLKADFERNRLLCIAPYTDAAGKDRSCTLSPCFPINLDPVAVVF